MRKEMSKSCAPPRGPVFSPQEAVFLGRDALVREIRERLQDRQRILLVGPEGIGKSALIRTVLGSGIDRLLNRALMVCQASTGVRAIVKAAGEQCPEAAPGTSDKGEEHPIAVPLPEGRQKAGLRQLQSALFRQVRQGRWLLVLDHLCSWDPGIGRLLEYLFEHDVLALGASRGTDVHDLGNVAKTVWRWHVVKLPPLAPSVCRRLLEHLTRTWPLEGSLRQDFCHRLLGLARGNPGALVEICRRAALKLDGTTSKIDPQHLWWDWLAERCS